MGNTVKATHDPKTDARVTIEKAGAAPEPDIAETPSPLTVVVLPVAAEKFTDESDASAHTVLGANPFDWLSRAGLPDLSPVAVASASSRAVTAAALPVRLMALGLLSGEMARLGYAVGEASLSAVIDLSAPGKRRRRSSVPRPSRLGFAAYENLH